jgi:hypothetical protein
VRDKSKEAVVVVVAQEERWKPRDAFSLPPLYSMNFRNADSRALIGL